MFWMLTPPGRTRSAMDQNSPSPFARAGLFGPRERVEYLLDPLFRNSGAAVVDFDHAVVALPGGDQVDETGIAGITGCIANHIGERAV